MIILGYLGFFFFFFLHGIDKISFPFSTTFPLNRPPTCKYRMMGRDKHMCIEDGVSRKQHERIMKNSLGIKC